MIKLRLIALFVLLGAPSAAAGESAPNLAPRLLLLSSTSAYDWNWPFAHREGERDSAFIDRELDRAVFATASKSIARPSFLKNRHNTASRPKRDPFGLLAGLPVQSSVSTPTLAAKRLLKIGAERQLQQTLFGPSGSLSALNLAKSLGDDAIVRGVNDEASSPPAPVDDLPATGESAPVRAPLAAYSGEKPGVPVRTRVVDASEGTPLDPLLNTTYDLNYPKTVPSMKELSREFAASRSNRP